MQEHKLGKKNIDMIKYTLLILVVIYHTKVTQPFNGREKRATQLRKTR